MSYARAGVYVCIKERLELAPATRLLDLASELKVSRHTIERCVRAATGQSFYELKHQILARHMKEALTLHPNLSFKEISLLDGCPSPRSFSRFGLGRGMSLPGALPPTRVQRLHRTGKKIA